MILFQIANEETPAELTNNQLEKWYKCSEILFVEMLNILMLVVGWLYWKGLNFFYRIKQLEAAPPLPFRDQFRFVIALLTFYCFAVFVASSVLVFIKADED